MPNEVITYRIAAVSDPAGKFNPDAPFNGNEDNFYVDDKLSDNLTDSCRTDMILEMDSLGCLLVVADGMGGMNAGEVASQIAIKTVAQAFAPGNITPDVAADPINRRRYLEAIVTQADQNIKADAAANAEHQGMGSTIIMAWIVGNDLTLTWCGDSRAYRYNPEGGIEPLSTDHSYVQELVNNGILAYEDTFEHPQGNIITRSLGDPNKAAEPETRQFKLCSGDIILLCSDGLSGVLRDRLTLDHSGTPYAGENIENIIADNQTSMEACCKALMTAAKEADWYDNVTVILCQIMSGAPAAPKKLPADIPAMPKIAPTAPSPAPSFPQHHVTPTPARHVVPSSKKKSSLPLLLVTFISTFLLILIAVGAWYYITKNKTNTEPETTTTQEPTPQAVPDNTDSNLGTAPAARDIRQDMIKDLYNGLVPDLEPYAKNIEREILDTNPNDTAKLKKLQRAIDQAHLRSKLIMRLSKLDVPEEYGRAAEQIYNTLISSGSINPKTLTSVAAAIDDLEKSLTTNPRSIEATKETDRQED